MGSWPCSLASASPSPASPFSRLPRGCEFAAVGSPGMASAVGGKGHATPSNALAGWDGHTACYRGKAAAWRHQSTLFSVGLGQDPSLPPGRARGHRHRCDPAAGIPPLPQHRGPGGDGNKPVACGVPARFYFHRCLKNKKENQFCLIYTKTEPKSRANANIRPLHRARLAAAAEGGVSGP